jgi:hypothetical protein
MILTIQMDGILNNLDTQLVTTVTCYGIDGGSWRICNDGLEELLGWM